MATATFQSAGHVYQIDGKVVPSVTQVLTLAGLDELAHVPRRFLARAATIGTAVHQACEFLDENDLDLDSLDPAIVGYVLGYQKFKLERNFEMITIERRGVAIDSAPGGLAYGFCLDRIGILDGKEVLIDIKTASKKSPGWAIQTAAYAEAVQFEGARLAIHVTKEGNYKPIPHDEPGDFDEWHRALGTAHWKLAHGAKLPN